MTDSIALRNGIVLPISPPDTLLTDACVIIENQRITHVGLESNLRNLANKADTQLDMHHHLIMPGLVNTHTHLWQTIGKGLGPDRYLWDWIQDAWTPLIKNMKPHDFYLATKLGLMEGLLSGTTCVMAYEHALGAYPNAIPEVAKGFHEVQNRGILGVGLQDTGEDAFAPDFILQSSQTIDHYLSNAFKKFHQQDNGLLQVWAAPGTVNWVTPALFQDILSITQEYQSGITVHCDESPSDIQYSQKRYGCPQTERLQNEGITGPHLLTVHLNHVSNKGIQIHAKTKTNFSHNPISNPYLASGVAPVPKLLDAGVNMGLATDGALSNNNQDMFDVIRITPLILKAYFKDVLAINAWQTLYAATLGGATCLGLGRHIGSLEPGKYADIIALDLNMLNVTPAASIPAALVYSASSENVDTVIVNGKIRIQNRQFTDLDPQLIIKNVQKAVKRIQESAQIIC